ncbi:hypothetical protein [Campylobacter fetus]|uniref:hypothetical protein n=1 Tax=Campylobacter fetus TaxID=196 RepID=UPI001287276E|nr:hypothetical protein [Campylobacter fetus]EAK0827471.1 hypothetical protein [Campylobacter fetus]
MKKVFLVLISLLSIGAIFANAYDHNHRNNDNYQRQYNNFQDNVGKINRQIESVGTDDFYKNSLPPTLQY